MRIPICFLVLLLLFAPGAKAGGALSLQDCLRLAREHDLRLRTAMNRVRHAALAQDELLAGRLPQLSVGAGGTIAPWHDRYGYDPAVTDGGQLTAQLILRQSLFDAGVRSIRAEQLRLDEDRAALDARIAERDRIFEVTRAFIDARRAQWKTAVLEESRGRLAEYLSLVRQSQQAGAATLTDVMKTEIQLSTLTSDVRTAEGEYDLARLTLAETIGIDPDTTITIARSNEEEATLLFSESPPADSLYPIELAQRELDRRRTNLDVELSARERLPAIGLVADGGYFSSVDNFRVPPGERYTGLGVSIGVQVEVPLFNGGATGLRIERDKLDVELQRIGLEMARRSFLAEYRRVTMALANAQQRLQDVRSRKRTAAEHYALTLSRYAGGQTTSLEVLDAQKMLTDVTLATADILGEIDLARAKIIQLTTH